MSKSTKATVATIPSWFEILPAVINAHAAHRVLLYGPPDTGKTTTASVINPDRTFRVQCSRQMGIEDLLGSFVLKSCGDHTETTFVPGPIPMAMQSGGVLVLDEFDLRNTAHDSLWHAVLDDTAIAEIRLPDGTVIRPKEGFTVIATTNATPSAFSAALQRRFEVKLFCGSSHPAALAKLEPALASLIQNWQINANPPAIRVEFSVSSLSAYSRLVKLYGQDSAAAITFGASASEFISALANNVK